MPDTSAPPRPSRQPASPPDQPGRRPVRAVLLAAGVVTVLVVGGLLWYLSRDAPASVDIETATNAVADADPDDQAAPNAASDADAAAAPDEPDTTAPAASGAAGIDGEIDGEWSVDTTIGLFSVTDTAGTFVGFRVAEELASIGVTEAVGRTPDVSGTVSIEGTALIGAEITADLTAIVSDQPRRDGAIQRALDTGTHPTATFITTEVVELGEDVASGEVVSVDVPGTLTIAGVASDVVVPLQVVVQGDTTIVTGALDIAFADYGVDTPTAPVVVSVEETGQVELQLYLTQR